MNNKTAPDEINAENTPKTIPLAEEQADLYAEKVVDRRVIIKRTTHAKEELLQTELYQEEVTIDHIAKNEEIEQGRFPPIRHEGDVVIIPVIEERVELIRRYILKEEIHIQKLKKRTPFQEKIDLRHQEINITTDEEDDQP